MAESFYAQHQLESLNLNHTILEEMQLCGSGKTDLELRSLLGGFMFGGDDIDKKIKILSGGEKARVALAKVIASKSNFLMLDEPTNHLDMHSVDLLAQALNKYEGSLIFVSHDRYFISKAANKIWEIIDYEIKEFKGSYAEYIEWKELMAKREKELSQQKNKTVTENITVKKTEEKKYVPINNLERDQKKELQKLQKQLEKTEEQINQLNKEKTELETQMSLPDSYAIPHKFKELEDKHKQLSARLSGIEKEYEMLFEKIVEMEN